MQDHYTFQKPWPWSVAFNFQQKKRFPFTKHLLVRTSDIVVVDFTTQTTRSNNVNTIVGLKIWWFFFFLEEFELWTIRFCCFYLSWDASWEFFKGSYHIWSVILTMNVACMSFSCQRLFSIDAKIVISISRKISLLAASRD